jgi:hypothetical protein
VKVYRQEVYDAIQAENREAAQSATAIPSIDSYLRKDERAAPPGRGTGGETDNS